MNLKIQKALISVSDKTNLEYLVSLLYRHGVEMIGSGGTAQFIKSLGVPVTPVSQVTGDPELFGGRMKTLSFRLASALLYRRGNEEDEKHVRDLGIKPIDLVVCNFYPFSKVVAENHLTDEEWVEWIDIGGPTMVRAAAKNFRSVCVLINAADYQDFEEEFRIHGGATSLSFRKKMALRALQYVTDYDRVISVDLENRLHKEGLIESSNYPLRYGENPHQRAYFRVNQPNSLFQVVSRGKELSYNNLLDVDSCWRILRDLHTQLPQGKATVVIKHQNPCGVSWVDAKIPGASALSIERAWKSDEKSAFGGIVGCQFDLTFEEVTFWNDKYVEVLLASSFSREAKTQLMQKKNLRLLQFQNWQNPQSEWLLRSCLNGILEQEEDLYFSSPSEWQCPTKKKFPERLTPVVQFGRIIAKHVKSNALALVAGEERDGKWLMELVAVGGGQPNRVDCLEKLISPRMKEKIASGYRQTNNWVLVSDAFFPFPDVVEIAAQLGIYWIVQPGGSRHDDLVISKADDLGVGMVLTKDRHFRH